MMEASLYDKIMDQQRLEPEFFRVGFYGKKFPFFLRVSKSGIKMMEVLGLVYFPLPSLSVFVNLIVTYIKYFCAETVGVN